MGKLRLPSYLSVVKDEYIKRSHRVGRVFLRCDLFNFMGNVMNGDIFEKIIAYIGLALCLNWLVVALIFKIKESKRSRDEPTKP